MTEEKIKVPRDKNVCFWCKFSDHENSVCRRQAPASKLIDGDNDEIKYYVEWPPISLAWDWCGEFEEGSCLDLLDRSPKDYDLEEGTAEVASANGLVVSET